MVKRYELIDVYEPGGADAAECETGDWVEYEDYAALESKLEKLSLAFAEMSEALIKSESRLDASRAAVRAFLIEHVGYSPEGADEQADYLFRVVERQKHFCGSKEVYACSWPLCGAQARNCGFP
jgi:hypothetical protein